MLSEITYKLSDNAFFVNNMVCIKSNIAYDIYDPTLPREICDGIDMLCRGEKYENFLYTQTFGEKSGFNFFSEAPMDCTTVAYVFNVNCKEETETIIFDYHSTNTKSYIWINNDYIGESNLASIIQIKLKKGDNIFCFLFSNFDGSPVLSVRLNKIVNESKVDYVALSIDNNIVRPYSENIIRAIYNKYKKGLYKGILFSFDRINCDISQDVEVDIVDYHNNKVYAKHIIRFNTPFEIDLSKIDFGENQEQVIVDMCIYYYRKGERCCLHEYFYSEDPVLGKERFLKECQELLDDPCILESTRCLLEMRKTRLLTAEKEGLSELRNALWWARFSLSGAMTGKSARYKYLPGKNDIIFKSEIDDKFYHYDVYLPYDYDESKKYPLVLNCCVNESVRLCNLFDRSNYKSNVIIANLTARGVTLGSYIGEVSMNEALSMIKKYFSIDEERISVFGFSNGATATWLQAQLTPHRFAAIAPCAGIFQPDMIKNLSNLKIFDIESPSDYEYWQKTKKYMDDFESISGYSLLEVEAFTHRSFQYTYVYHDMINELSKHTIEKYPNDIYFKVIHNRHLEAYWISVHSIQDYAEYGNIEAHIESNDTININCLGITGFTIHIPPQITGDKIYVYVNDQRVICERSTNNQISIVKIDGTDTFIEGKADKEKFKIYHGTGLLDVYLTPMSIINFAPKAEWIVNSAIEFSSPKTNTYSPQINVSYPIYTEDTLDIPSFENRSLVILDNNSSNNFALDLKKLCEIKMYSDGFSYKDKRYEGSYCIMQILQHPNNPNCSILYINANDAEMYHKNFFTRYVRTPMYSKTRHPYLNNSALVYYNDKYYSVFEYGCEMRLVQK